MTAENQNGPGGCRSRHVIALFSLRGSSPPPYRSFPGGAQAQTIDAQTPDLKAARGRPQNSSDKKNVATISGRRGADYALARLRKDRPDIHARVMAGELTPHAGMIEAVLFAPKRSTRRTGPTQGRREGRGKMSATQKILLTIIPVVQSLALVPKPSAACAVTAATFTLAHLKPRAGARFFRSSTLVRRAQNERE